MKELLVLGGMAAAGYAMAPLWVVPVGAGFLTLAGWWRKLRPLRRAPQVPFSTKMTAYLVVSVVIDLAFASASYVMGRMLAVWLGS